MGGRCGPAEGSGWASGSTPFLGILVASRLENISPVPLLLGLRGPLLACLPLVGAVLGVRFLLRVAGFASR
jgi:hypothetical protein